MFIKKSVKMFVLVVLVLAMSGFTYAFANTNTVPESYAGDGTGDISGYEVSAIQYTLDTNPTILASVTFTLDNDATDVFARIGTGAWSNACTLATGVWTCAFTDSPTVVDALKLQVVAAN